MSDERENAPRHDIASDSAHPLADGRYDAFIIWAEGRDGAVELSCTVTTGPHRGDVVEVISSTFTTRDPFELVGLPCTLVVTGNEIRVEK